MASSQSAAASSSPRANPRAEYYPLWRHVTKLQRCGGGGSWEWRCNLCNNTYKGSYPRMKVHLLHGRGQGISGCTKTTDPLARRAYQREQDEVDVIKRRHDELSQATPQAPSNIEPGIVVEARKRRVSATQQHEQPPSKNTRGASASVQDSRIAKLVNVQARKEIDSRVARCIYACGIPFNVVCFPYWQDMIREVNKAPIG